MVKQNQQMEDGQFQQHPISLIVIMHIYHDPMTRFELVRTCELKLKGNTPFNSVSSHIGEYSKTLSGTIMLIS